jgi:hypothetical protein
MLVELYLLYSDDGPSNLLFRRTNVIGTEYQSGTAELNSDDLPDPANWQTDNSDDLPDPASSPPETQVTHDLLKKLERLNELLTSHCSGNVSEV